jgi:hypothetical protein
MAPLLVDYLDPGPLAESLKERLQAADLWARYRSAENLAAALEIFDACKGQVPPLTLLKGLSIGPERYPAPHYRFLGDLDLLVPEEALRETQRVLETLGYVASRSAFDGESDHHLPALRHPRTGVVVELHRGLFSSRHGFDREGPFAARRVLAERRPSELEGRQVFRLSPELQVVYTASHWALRFSPAAGPRGLLDMLLLLRGEGDSLDWHRIVDWLEDRRIAAHLQLMIHCLNAWGLVEIPPQLGARPERLEILEPQVLEILMGMTERYQLRGVMAGVPDLVERKRVRTPCGASPSGTLRSRLQTLRTALVMRNLSGLVLLLDRMSWDALIKPDPSLRRRLLISWCRIFPPGSLGRRRPMKRRRSQR